MAEPLTPNQVLEAANRLTVARLSVSLLEHLHSYAPADLPSAHSIADKHAELLGWDVAGWKVGGTSALAREILSCPEPFPGRVFENSVLHSGTVDRSAIDKPLLESEFAFQLQDDLPPRESPYTAEDVKAATATVAPAFEIVTSRFSDWLSVGYLSIVADCGSNGGVIFGDPIAAQDCPTLSEVDVQLTIDGQEIANGSGSDILDDPWNSLAWLANDLSSRQIGLHAGEFVMSGTCTGAHPFPEGATATANFEGFGQVTARRTALT